MVGNRHHAIADDDGAANQLNRRENAIAEEGMRMKVVHAMLLKEIGLRGGIIPPVVGRVASFIHSWILSENPNIICYILRREVAGNGDEDNSD